MKPVALLLLSLLLAAAATSASAETLTKRQVIDQANADCRTGTERVRHWNRLGWQAAKARHRARAVRRYRRSQVHRERAHSRLADLQVPQRGHRTWRDFLHNTKKLNGEFEDRIDQYADGAHRNVFRFLRLTALNYQRLAMAAAAEYDLGNACARLLKK